MYSIIGRVGSIIFILGKPNFLIKAWTDFFLVGLYLELQVSSSFIYDEQAKVSFTSG